jgi:Tfp pilus assembly protein PilO
MLIERWGWIVKLPFKLKWLSIDASAVGACAAATLLVYLLGFGPLLSQREAIDAQRQDMEQTRDKGERLQGTSRVLRARLATAQSQLATSHLRLQSIRQLNQRLSELAEFSQKSGLEMQDVRPGTLTRAARYAQMQIHVSGNGSYPNCTAFFHDLHQRFGDMAISSFDLRNGNAPNAPATFSFDIAWFVSAD